MTDRVRMAHRRARLRRGQVVYAAMPIPAWVPDPLEPSSRIVRVFARSRTGRLQPLGEAALRTLSDGSAVRSVLSR